MQIKVKSKNFVTLIELSSFNKIASFRSVAFGIGNLFGKEKTRNILCQTKKS